MNGLHNCLLIYTKINETFISIYFADRGVINTVGNFLEQLDMSGINERVIIDVTDDLREHYVEWVYKKLTLDDV